MAVLYVVAAWLIMQVAEVVIGLANLPEWMGPTVLGLLAIGFPIALILSWLYELTPGGISLEKDVEPGESITHVTGRRLDFIIIAVLCAGLILFAYDKWWVGPPPERSIAVLAFENMSGDPGQEYFSDGIAEELLNMLAQVPELRVISRSSAFSFKGKDVPLPEIAQQLNVAHILEGSVRRADGQVRITAQLIEAHSDTHLWSQTYDRTLDDIFAIQDEIATEVVAQLKVRLLGATPSISETDPQAYALYLQARYLGRQETRESLERSNALYRQALEIDPDLAAAWVGLADNYSWQLSRALRPAEDFPEAQEFAEKALAINPDLADAHARLGWITEAIMGDLTDVARHYEKALALESAEADTLLDAAGFVNRLGRQEESIAIYEYAVARDPVNPKGHYCLGVTYHWAGYPDKALASLQTALTLSPSMLVAREHTGLILLEKGEPEAALAEIRQEPHEGWRLYGLAAAHHSLGQTAESDAALAELIEKYGVHAAAKIACLFAYLGEADRAFEWLDKAVQYNDGGLAEVPVESTCENIRTDARWLPFLESIGRSPEQLEAIEFDVSLPDGS